LPRRYRIWLARSATGITTGSYFRGAAELALAMNSCPAQLDSIIPTALTGGIVRTEGLAAAVAGLPAPVGAVVEIDRLANSVVGAEVIGFRGNETIVYPLGEMTGVRKGNRVRLRQTRRMLRVGPGLLGRVIDSRGKAIDNRQPTHLDERIYIHSP